MGDSTSTNGEATNARADERSSEDRTVVSVDEAQALIELAQLELSQEHVATLASMLSDYRDQVAQLRRIEVLDHEPPVITNDQEAFP